MKLLYNHQPSQVRGLVATIAGERIDEDWHGPEGQKRYAKGPEMLVNMTPCLRLQNHSQARCKPRQAVIYHALLQPDPNTSSMCCWFSLNPKFNHIAHTRAKDLHFSGHSVLICECGAAFFICLDLLLSICQFKRISLNGFFGLNKLFSLLGIGCGCCTNSFSLIKLIKGFGNSLLKPPFYPSNELAFL